MHALAGFLVLVAEARPAWAVRPFITDDARVVGGHAAQLETWTRLDATSIEHWMLVGFGPVGPLELTAGGVHGASYENESPHYGAAGPLLQAKLLLWGPRPNGLPGVAMAGGMVLPVGLGAFAPGGWDLFEYVAVTQSLLDRDRLLIHLNVGVFGSTDPSRAGVVPTWGAGAQLRTIGELHGVAEVFSGDPYVGSNGVAVQGGFRYIVSHAVQVDGTIGSGVSGQPALPMWGTVGLRLASPALW